MEKLWKEIENEFNIKFFTNEGDFRPVNEWLDDIYLTLTPSQLEIMMKTIMNNGDILFENLMQHK